MEEGGTQWGIPEAVTMATPLSPTPSIRAIASLPKQTQAQESARTPGESWGETALPLVSVPGGQAQCSIF